MIIGPDISVYLALGPVDLRGASDRLAAVTRSVLERDPSGGALFLFLNRRKNRLKALWWDRNGYALLYKKLVRGTFFLPQVQDANCVSLEISVEDFVRLLSGLPLAGLAKHSPTLH